MDIFNELAQPDHLLPLSDGWGVWRWVCLRSAGFPARLALGLSDTRCAAQADRVYDAEQALEQQRRLAKQAVNRALDQLHAGGAWSDKGRRNPLLNALRAVDRNERPDPVSDPNADQALSGFTTALDLLHAAHAEYNREFAEAGDRISAQISQAAGMPAFREAVVWQNRQAAHGSMASLLTADSHGRSNRREELSVARYLQRYSLKNDTIGFFGPVGWAQFTEQGEAVTVAPGAGLLSNREVFFEGWAIEALAATLAQDPAFRPWMTPRKVPFARLEGRVLHLPLAGAIPIPAEHAAVLQLCDGQRTAREIARALRNGPFASALDEARLLGILEQLVKQRRITWEFEVPVALRPETYLRRQLDRIADEPLRRQATAQLDDLTAARDALAQSAGDAVALDQAMAHLEATFSRVTGLDPTRRHGETYAARTLVYEECCRDMSVAFGPDLLQSLREPLSLLLMSTRWLSQEVVRFYRQVFDNAYTELARRSGSASVSFADFCLWVTEVIFKEHIPELEPTVAEFRRRWAEILSLPAGERTVRYTSEALRDKVMAAFGTAAPGWEHCRYHSPDIMITAASPEAIRAGEYQFVMGELHVAMNTLGINALWSQHPDPEAFMRALDWDLPGPRVVQVIPRTSNLTARTAEVLATPDDYWLHTGLDAAPIPNTRVLPAGDLLVQKEGDRLIVRSHRGGFSLDLFSVMHSGMTPAMTDMFRLRPPGGHVPRVSIDRLVILRESWEFPVEQMHCVQQTARSERFLAVRRWALANGLPRFVFVRTPLERKPYFVDFESPLLTDSFATALSSQLQTGTAGRPVSITEMLPSFEDLWLTDAQGERYTSELRIAAVDLAEGEHC